MKLRAITLSNVRRFANRQATLADIGDGITVLCEPNEFGKSTFFDALHALFFEKHRGTGKTVKSLQPHAGGAPEVTVEVDLPEGRFRIAKRWLQRPHAQITDATGRLIAQADEAEAWIDRLVGGDLAGPSGLLWVRQGITDIDPDSLATRDRDRNLATRRDLLSTVAGEIDQMTGGRRMDAVLDRVTQALDLLATPTGRPKGDWAQALKQAETLASEEAQLSPRAAALSGDLARRAETQRTLARLTDPQDIHARDQALRQAEAADQQAQAHQAQVEQAHAALRLATLDAEAAEREAAALQSLATRAEQARAAARTADETAAKARTRAEDLAARDRTAAQAADTAAAATRDLRTLHARALRAQAARAAVAQAQSLQQRLDRATTLQDTLNADRARRARITVTPKAVEQADRAQAALDIARARAEQQAVTVDITPDHGATATANGTPVPPGPHPVFVTTDYTLPGFGRLRVDPGQQASAAALATAEQAAQKAILACGTDTLAAARAALAQAQQLDATITNATALLAEIAPNGPDALRTALARAQADAAGADDTAGNPDDLARQLTLAEQAESEARAAARTAHDLATAASEARAAAEADRITATRHLAEAEQAAGDPATLAHRIAALQDSLPNLRALKSQAAETLTSLRANAPDPATVQARLDRARSADEQARKAIATAREDLVRLNATIAAMADEGIEERLSTITDALAEAKARAARYDAEVRALTRLRRALEDARTAAREAYFGPVLRELQPLLAILHPGARIEIDDTSLLPDRLVRDGQTEDMNILSGGTREQIAILARLAFARLFLAAGKSVPVILDDALVHSDDDRIEAMFNALHRTARDQQILVLTCRSRAFAALGGTRATVRIEQR